MAECFQPVPLFIEKKRRGSAPPKFMLFLFLPRCQVVHRPVLEDDIAGVRTALLDKDRIGALVLGGRPRYLGPDALEVRYGVELL